jgi:hypothetical protein
MNPLELGIALWALVSAARVANALARLAAAAEREVERRNANDARIRNLMEGDAGNLIPLDGGGGGEAA